MTMSTHEDDSGAISPSGRFARMEASLNRIEEKLDLKADQAALEALETRVALIETVGTPRVQEAVSSFKRLEQHVNDLETGRVQTPQTQEVMKSFQKALSDIADLKRDALVKDTAITATKESNKAIADARYAQMRTIVTISSVINGILVALASLVTALSLLHVI
jgi:hypothetical protein